MWIGGKSILMGSHFLDRINVVDVPKNAPVENDEGTIRISVSDGKETWRMALGGICWRSEGEIKLLRLLLRKASPLLDRNFGTKRAKLEVLREELGIDFGDLRKR